MQCVVHALVDSVQMDPAFHSIILANEIEGRDIFLTTANRLGIAIQSVEKDF